MRSNRILSGRRLLAIGVAVATVASVGPVNLASASVGGHNGHAAAAAASAGTISTIAGGVGGPGRATSVAVEPTDVTYSAGHLFIADEYVREVSSTGRLTTPVGDLNGQGILQGDGDGGPAARASTQAQATAVAPDGTMAIAENFNMRVRLVAATTGTFYGQSMTAGDIYTIAGTGSEGYSGDGGLGTKAELNSPGAVAFDPAGNVLIGDSGNARVRVVAVRTGTFYGQSMTAGYIYTVAGTGKFGFSGDGGPAVDAMISHPNGLTVDHAGNIVIADSSNGRLRVVAASTGVFYGQQMTAGDIYLVAGDGRSTPVNGVPAVQSGIESPLGPSVDAAGNLVFTDAPNNIVRVVAVETGTFYGQPMLAGYIYTVAGTGTNGYSGDGGSALKAEISDPFGTAVDGSGNIVVADTNNNRVRVVASTSGTFWGVKMTAGDIYTVAGDGYPELSGNRGPALKAEILPAGLAVDSAGNLLFADFTNEELRVIAAQTGRAYGQPMTAGDVYDLAGNGTSGYTGDGGSATKAELAFPTGVTLDAAGNLVITDNGNNRIRVVAVKSGTFYGQSMTAGDIYTVAGSGKCAFSGDGGPATQAELCQPQQTAVDAAGNLVIADSTNNRIRVVAVKTGTFYGQSMTAGDIYTVAGNGTRGYAGDGGPALQAEFSFPEGLALDGPGNIVIADAGNNRIRVAAVRSGTFYGVAMTAGSIYTVAGNGAAGYGGDGGPPTKATLNFPFAVLVDGAGNLVIADSANERVRMVAAKTGTFYGVAVKAGNIYTIAGNGLQAFSGDGGPATSAGLSSPGAFALAGRNLDVADGIRIRMITG